jgi:hypothetical protein
VIGAFYGFDRPGVEPSEAIIERVYPNLIYFNEAERGLEQIDLVASAIGTQLAGASGPRAALTTS